MDYKTTLREIKALRKQKRPREALELTLELKQHAWNDPYLHRLVQRLNQDIQSQEKSAEKNFLKTSLETIRTLQKAGHFEAAIKGCRELLEVAPGNPKALKALHENKMGFIDEKLKDPLQKTWEAEGKYEKLYLFYLKLKKIFPEHPRLQKLLEKTEKKVIEQDRERKKTFAEESLKKLEALFIEKKYEAVIQGTEELIRYTHQGSAEAKKLLQKAQKENRKEIERDIQSYLKTQTPHLKAAFIAQSEPMIRL